MTHKDEYISKLGESVIGHTRGRASVIRSRATDAFIVGEGAYNVLVSKVQTLLALGDACPRGAGDGGSGVSNRLDHSQEGLELRRAVWAGFFKSRYWRIRGRIELHAVFGAFILWGTLLYGGLSIGLLLVQKRLPSSSTTLNVLFAAIGLASLWYVVYPNRGLLRRFWENPWGKLFYSLVAAFIVTLSKAAADQMIRLLTQSNPSLFPSAQPLITLLIIATMTPMLVGFFLILISMFMYSKAYLSSLVQMVLPESVFHFKEMLGLPTPRQPFRSRTTWGFAYFWGGFFVVAVISEFNTIIPFNPMEELLLWSSFIPNGSAASDRVCLNLPPGTFVSPFDARTPVPNEVLMAEQIPSPDSSGRSYTYRVVPCLKSTPSGPPHSGSSTATGAMAPNGRAPAADTAVPSGPPH